MKFGLESEKFLFNTKEVRPSGGIFRFLDALSDYEPYISHETRNNITNEFVMNMVEIGTNPSHEPIDVMEEYLFLHLLIQQVAKREDVSLVSLGSLPMNYSPHMTPKWAYIIQNSILAGKKQQSWTMKKNSPLRSAGNCAGIHIHAELETAPEFLFSNRELQDKFNISLMLTPMIAFASSPYFFGSYLGKSSRAIKYYGEVYKNFPLNGSLPPVMNSSEEVLIYFKKSIEHWVSTGLKLGLPEKDLLRVTARKGANWNPVRWNRFWNTIELRFFDSDRLDLDCAKFFWVTEILKRFNPKGEALRCEILKTNKKIDKKMIAETFLKSGNVVSILPNYAIQQLFDFAMREGLENPLVEEYLFQIANFVDSNLDDEKKWIFQILKRVLDHQTTTSDVLLGSLKYKKRISTKQANELIFYSLEEEKKVLRLIKRYLPNIEEKLKHAHHSWK